MEGTRQGSCGPLRDHGLGESDKAALCLKLGDLIQQAGNVSLASSGTSSPQGPVFLSPLLEGRLTET